MIEKSLRFPLEWRSPKRIFVNSMSDLFHEALPDEAIDRIFSVMGACPQHTFQALTKRPERMLQYMTDRPILRNLWLGTSVENQENADARIPLLLGTPAALRFVSYEPASGPVDFSAMGGLDWIITGGESGPDEDDRNLLAWRDGFRPEGNTITDPRCAFALMLEFWSKRLPFHGDVIHWAIR